MRPRTRYLARLIGLYCIFIALSMSADKPRIIGLVDAITRNQPLLLVTGVITMAAGLAIVVGHNVWSGGVTPVVVTLVGWTALTKGLLLIILSPGGEQAFIAAFRYEQLFYLYMGFTFLTGVWLAWAGFRAEAR